MSFSNTERRSRLHVATSDPQQEAPRGDDSRLVENGSSGATHKSLSFLPQRATDSTSAPFSSLAPPDSRSRGSAVPQLLATVSVGQAKGTAVQCATWLTERKGKTPTVLPERTPASLSLSPVVPTSQPRQAPSFSVMSPPVYTRTDHPVHATTSYPVYPTTSGHNNMQLLFQPTIRHAINSEKFIKPKNCNKEKISFEKIQIFSSEFFSSRLGQQNYGDPVGVLGIRRALF